MLVRLMMLLGLSCSTPAVGEPPVKPVAVKDFGIAPDFTLRTTKGALVRLSDYRGKVVLLNFWATWCTPCIHEMPHLQKMYSDLEKEGFIVFGISEDEARHYSGVGHLAKKIGIKYPILLDKSRDVMKLYNPSGVLPYSVVIKKDGDIYAFFEGYTPGMENEIRKAVEEALDNAG